MPSSGALTPLDLVRQCAERVLRWRAGGAWLTASRHLDTLFAASREVVTAMIELSHTVLVNDPAASEAPVLTRDDVWEGLVMKAENALPFVPKMEKCDVVERKDNYILRDIRFGGDDLREEVTLTPKTRVEFRRVAGRVLGLITNEILDNSDGELELRFSFHLEIEGVDHGSREEREYEENMRDAYMGAVSATLGAIRKMTLERAAGR
jgi:hypothetical protein